MNKFFAIFAAGLLVFAARAEEVKCRVSLTSQPSGAMVIVDRRDRGTTPLMLFDLEPGRHHVKYRLPGYQERDRFIRTDQAAFVEKNEVLQEVKGLLLLKTDPEGADIRIDGVSVGTTPRLITNLAAKDSYQVKFLKPGYREQIITVKFDGRTPLVREEKLVLDSGVLHIMSEPAGAEVTVNGIVRGNAPLLVKDVPKGRALVKFHLEGFQDEIRELEMRAGEQQTLPVSLTALPGTLHVVSVPEGARFYVNEEPRGKGPLVIANLKPGEYSVRAEMEGYGDLEKKILIENGKAAREEFRLSNKMGRLEVKTSPVGARVFFDGRNLGVTRSSDPEAELSDIFPIENILEGEHTLVVKAEGYAETTRHPKIRSTKTSVANVRLKRVFIPDVEIETARGVYRGILQSRSPDGVTVEVRLGITQNFSNSEIRKIIYPLPAEKAQ